MDDNKPKYRYEDLSTSERQELFESIVRKFTGRNDPHSSAMVRCPIAAFPTIHGTMNANRTTSRQAVEKEILNRDLTKARYDADLQDLVDRQRGRKK